MTPRPLYLGTSGASRAQRAHFSLFIPNAGNEGIDVAQDFRSVVCYGTVIHGVGEPVMAGYALEIKRNYDRSTDQDLRAMTLLGYVDSSILYESENSTTFIKGTPRGALERHAANVPIPPRGQNVRAPIDGVSSSRNKGVKLLIPLVTDLDKTVSRVDSGLC
jgi:hypothetical protein